MAAAGWLDDGRVMLNRGAKERSRVKERLQTLICWGRSWCDLRVAGTGAGQGKLVASASERECCCST